MSDKKIPFGKRLTLDLFSRTYDRLVESHPLKTLFWECTLRCNAACLHCGSDCKVSSQISDMPVSDFINVIDNIRSHVDPHTTFVIFTGGECLVRRDLEVAGMELKKREFPWGIVTNGILLTPERFRSLRNAGMLSATVSLDGFEKEHNWMRNVSGCYEKAVRAVKVLASEPGFLFDVVTCVNRRNIVQLEELKHFLISIGVRKWRLFSIFPVGRAADYPEFQLDDEEFTQVLKFIEKTRKEGIIELNYACEGFLGGYELEVRDHPYFCAAGITVASVLADGSISACPSIRADFHQGNIYKDDFWSVWSDGFCQYRDRSWAKQGICSDCKVWKYCRGNGMHLHEGNGKLLVCHYNRIKQ